ncbi:MAG: hypothetical protein GY774_00350 [Planctomycetes bacterium]|nr:hypothetical protein [Planctomycetota bacterium]
MKDGIITGVHLYSWNNERHRNNVTSIMYSDYLFAVEVRYGGIANETQSKIINYKSKSFVFEVKKREIRKIIDAYRILKELDRPTYEVLQKHLCGRIKAKMTRFYSSKLKEMERR